MAKIKIDGRELRLVDSSSARNRDVVALQIESGMKLSELQTTALASELFALCLLSFLSQRNAGIFVKWDDLLDGGPEALGEVIAEPGDLARVEGKQTPDPQLPDPQTGAAAEQ